MPSSSLQAVTRDRLEYVHVVQIVSPVLLRYCRMYCNPRIYKRLYLVAKAAHRTVYLFVNPGLTTRQEALQEIFASFWVEKNNEASSALVSSSSSAHLLIASFHLHKSSLPGI